MLLYSIRRITLESSFNGRTKLCTLFLVLCPVFLSSGRNLNNTWWGLLQIARCVMSMSSLGRKFMRFKLLTIPSSLSLIQWRLSVFCWIQECVPLEVFTKGPILKFSLTWKKTTHFTELDRGRQVQQESMCEEITQNNCIDIHNSDLKMCMTICFYTCAVLEKVNGQHLYRIQYLKTSEKCYQMNTNSQQDLCRKQ